jgi:hypothetical protein
MTEGPDIAYVGTGTFDTSTCTNPACDAVVTTHNEGVFYYAEPSPPIGVNMGSADFQFANAYFAGDMEVRNQLVKGNLEVLGTITAKTPCTIETKIATGFFPPLIALVVVVIVLIRRVQSLVKEVRAMKYDLRSTNLP